MKKMLSNVLLILMIALFAVNVSADGLVLDKEYVPHWTKMWVPKEAQNLGMWKGFYIVRTDNVLKTDLIMVGGGDWKIPGDPDARIWEGLNIVQPSDLSDCGYMFTAVEAGKVEFNMTGKLDQPTSTDIEISVFKNNFSTKIYPTDAPAVLCKFDEEKSINFIQDLSKGDKIFFVFHSPAEIADTCQFRFTVFNASYRQFGLDSSSSSESSSESSSSSSSESSSQSSSISSSSKESSSQVSESDVSSMEDSSQLQSEDSSSEVSFPDIIIDDDTSFPMKTRYDDVSVDETQLIVTLTKKLTVKDFLDSFDLKDGYTIKLFNTDATEVKDDNSVVNDEMVVKLYNKGTPISVLKIITSFPDETEEPQEKKPVFMYVIFSVTAIIVLTFASLFIVKRRNKK